MIPQVGFFFVVGTLLYQTNLIHCFSFLFKEQREREKQDLEYAKEIAEDDDDFP